MYQTASRIWLTAAGLSLLLPASERLFIWLPLHLALAGAVTVAISGAMQTFAVTLTAAPSPPGWLMVSQFALVNLGAGLIAVGRPTDLPGVVAVGGTSFVAAALLLGSIVWNARRRSLHHRHRFPIAMYLTAVGCVLAGGTLGALIGSGAVTDAGLWLKLRRAHMALNVMGFVALTIAGTLITLLPTVLRIRLPAWRGAATGWLLGGGVSVLAAGLALGFRPAATVGALAYAAGSAGLVSMAATVFRTERRWPVPLSAKHFVAALVWFVAWSFGLAIAMLVGSFDGYRRPFLIAFVGGWAVQALLGAWLYLLPMGRPAHPDERRGFLAMLETGGTIQVLALNMGLIVMAMRAVGWVPDIVGVLGVGLALGGAGIALVKAWMFPFLSRHGEPTERARAVWGG